MKGLASALVAGLIGLATGVSAQTVFELAFRTGTLDTLKAGDRLDYSSIVTLPAGGGTGDSTVSVALREGRVAALEEQEIGGDAPRGLGRFKASVGNPLGMYFLERTVRSVSEQTGGSPFYLRNRFKDALRATDGTREVEVMWNGHPIPATEIVMAPFEDDPNRARLGAFADLQVRLIVAEAVPGWYHKLSAQAGNGAYASSLSLSEVAE